MHVGLTADSYRIAETSRHLGKQLVCHRSSLARLFIRLKLTPQLQRVNTAVPRPKVLCRELATTDNPKVVVHIHRANAVDITGVIEVLKQLLTRQRLAASHDARDTRVLQRN